MDNLERNRGGGGGEDHLGFLFGGPDGGVPEVPKVEKPEPSAARVSLGTTGDHVDFKINVVEELTDSAGGLLSDTDVRGMTLADLRTLCRKHGLSPAGSRDTLVHRVLDACLEGTLKMAGADAKFVEQPTAEEVKPNEVAPPKEAYEAAPAFDPNVTPMRPKTPAMGDGKDDIAGFKGLSSSSGFTNQYTRVGTPNQGNFMTDTNGKLIVQPPGGNATFKFG